MTMKRENTNNTILKEAGKEFSGYSETQKEEIKTKIEGNKSIKEKVGQYLFIIVAIVQTILHYLGIFGIVLGVIALIFHNTQRAIELLIGGFSFIVIKYIVGFIFVPIIGLLTKQESKED